MKSALDRLIGLKTKCIAAIHRTVVLLLLSTVGPSVLGQGDLTPPGPPGPTMKTLAQVEPRTPISSLPFVITNAGSYYVTTNLRGQPGIVIAASGVTVELMGFELVGGGGAGVAVQSGHSNVCVRNGTLRGWSGNGVSAADAFSSRFEALQLVGNRNLAGISVGRGCIVTHCIAINNDNYGIEARPGSLVSHCVAWGNFLGIYVGPGGRATDCTSVSNTLTGIWADSGSTVSDCTVTSNEGDGILARNGCRVTASQSVGNGSAGIRVVGSGSTITDCTVSTNAGDGIVVTNGCRLASNHCYDNGSAGIRASGFESAIENNVLIANQRGIWIDRVDGRNLVVRNMARNNFLSGVGNRNYDIATGNRVAQTVILPFNTAALAGETGGNASSTTDPWSNISY